MKGKWRRLFRLHVKNADYALDYLMACAVLHNFVLLERRERARRSPIRFARFLLKNNLKVEKKKNVSPKMPHTLQQNSTSVLSLR